MVGVNIVSCALGTIQQGPGTNTLDKLAAGSMCLAGSMSWQALGAAQSFCELKDRLETRHSSPRQEIHLQHKYQSGCLTEGCPSAQDIRHRDGEHNIL